MGATFRESMDWLHTWAGLVVGVLLFAIFWTGTLCVFDREIDRWMNPSTRIVYSGEPIAIDGLREEATRLSPRAAPWAIVLPTSRDPVLWIGYRARTGFERTLLDPLTMKPIAPAESWAGTRFFFPFHHTLHLKMWNLGTWLTGLAGAAMMALCISGVIIHRKIFVDFFTLRRSRQPQRLLLDLHSTAGTLGFIFFFVMSFSGVTILASVYFPSGVWVAFDGGRSGYVKDTYDVFSRPRLNQPGPPLGSLDAMVASAREAWGGLNPGLVRVFHHGDRNSYVEVRPSIEAAVNMRTDPFFFDAATGEVLYRTYIRDTTQVQMFLTGLHFTQFRHWTLRWVYFALGLLGCFLIVTGFLFWVERRRKAHLAAGSDAGRFVEGLAAGGTGGMVLATLAFFVVNRLLPSGATFLGGVRYELEIWVFFGVWVLSFVHAWTRRTTAWIDQCWVAAALSVLAVALNGLTTGDHLFRALADGKLAVAGMDLVLLAGAFAAALTAWRLLRRRQSLNEPISHHRLEGQSP
ncbi:MAG: PepSY domain-containing protein [Reyranella sp.]|jgi:uncharacterized iron-regulated membrane protein|nr:MAG: PepSY domain-containing protein [Reyranella sp.]